ncbi:MAG TPA: VOC family protein [Streptosporangiaceae bacterium]|jgi:catechol 2,3-dioxygenase-like lactoylglutathione lyase family enzyme
MELSYVFAGLIVADRDKAAAWYARLLGRPADMLPNDAEATWRLANEASLYLLADPGRAGQSVLTLIVPDLDAELARMAADGITPTRIEVLEAGRKCVVEDPDGNQIGLAQLS